MVVGVRGVTVFLWCGRVEDTQQSHWTHLDAAVKVGLISRLFLRQALSLSIIACERGPDDLENRSLCTEQLLLRA